jgi:hypothetical protein
MEKECSKMYTATNELLAVIRTQFPEIDLMALSNSVGRRYDAQMADIAERFSRPLPALKARGGGAKSRKSEPWDS